MTPTALRDVPRGAHPLLPIIDAQDTALAQAPDRHTPALDLLHKIASRLPGMVYQFQMNADGSSCFPFASDAIQDIYRVRPEDVRDDASAVFKNIHPEDLHSVGLSIDASARNLTPWQHEYRVKFDDGSVRWLFGNALPERSGAGATLWHGFITDITTQKQTEKALRLSEHRIQATLDAIPDLLFELSLTGQYLYVHAQRSELLYSTAPSLLGLFVNDVLPSASAQVVMAGLREANEQGYSTGKVHMLPLAQGEVYFELSISRKVTDIGEIPRFIVLSRDITARVKSQEKLQISDLALNAISQGVLISGPDGRIQSTNAAFLTITGFSSSDVLGRTCHFVQGPLTDQATLADIRQATASALEFKGDILNYRKDGSIFWNELSISPLFDSNGQLIHFIGITRDITARKKADESIQAASVFTNTHEGIMITSPDGVIVNTNDAFTRITGYSRDEAIGQTPRLLSSGHQSKDFYAKLWLELREQDHWAGEIWNQRKNGETYAEMLTINAVRDAQGKVSLYFALFSDITERKRLEAEVKVAREYAENIVASVREPLIILNAELRILTANRSFYATFQVTPAETIGQLIHTIGNRQWHIPKLLTLFETIITDASEFNDFEVEHDFVGIGAKTMLLNAREISREKTSSHLILFAMEDVTERKQLEKQVHQLAFYDALTQLPNRRLLSDRLSQLMAASKRSACSGAVLVLDLDHFKSLNDTHGHLAGDLLLVEAAQRLSQCVREMDTVARFGGDEFIVLLGELHADKALATEQASAVAEKIRLSLAQIYQLTLVHQNQPASHIAHHCTASIGVLVFDPAAAEQNEVLKQADSAMYQAKAEHGNRVRFYTSQADALA